MQSQEDLRRIRISHSSAADWNPFEKRCPSGTSLNFSTKPAREAQNLPNRVSAIAPAPNAFQQALSLTTHNQASTIQNHPTCQRRCSPSPGAVPCTPARYCRSLSRTCVPSRHPTRCPCRRTSSSHFRRWLLRIPDMPLSALLALFLSSIERYSHSWGSSQRPVSHYP